ncbi:MAG: hypothetical protein Q7R31_04670 [Candidatus Levybacteria bacterium]|nr:hypothetical protein [Candidatus Levybacteria bacterium]
MQVPLYYARKGSHLNDRDAQVIGPVLDQLAQSRVPLTAPTVVEEAKPEASPLHRYFEWSDPKAAQLHREEQARRILRAIVIRIAASDPDGEAEEVRKFINIEVAPSPGAVVDETQLRPYITVEQVLEDPEQVRQQAEKAEKMLEFWERENRFWWKRHVEFARFNGVFKAIADLRKAAREEVHALV